MAAASSSSSSSATIGGFTYDVFLSFRGEDTRYDFTGSLWKALVDKGIRTFFDEEDIHKGDEITPLLLQSIEQSRMALVVLSPNYASSSFCLDELSHILDSIKGNGRFVWPIFYEVDPSDVRKLKRTYEEAMTGHEANSKCSMGRLEKWKKALNQVANLSGTHFKKGDKYLYKFIEEIVEEVSTKIKPLDLHVANYLVGLGSPMDDVISLLDLGFDDEVRMVGIHGIGGIGKTTLAVAVYNSIASQFHGSCYLENVREKSKKQELTDLQEIVLSKIVGGKKIELTSFREGIETIKQRLGQNKVLLLLDDVDKEEQLQAIVGRPDWFGRGSRVIITTRDTRLLTCHEVESKYEVKLLNKEDAFELLRQKAIRTNEVSPSYMDVLNRALTYASGLPLALEVIGSHLFKKTVEECKYALDRYERIPDQKIQTILKVSFDALDEEEKSIFLDIACIFNGYMLECVEKILHAHYGESKKHHISVLIEKSLIKISEYGQVTLHDLIADMGEEFVRQESPDDPGRRSRLWDPKDIVQVLEENRGTSKIEIIYFDSAIEVKWNGEAFKKMENLKTLIIKRGGFLKSPKHLPNSLRVWEWWDYSGDVPSDFYPKRLVICKFYANCTSFIREDFFRKKFENMRILRIEDCGSLTQIPNISCLLNLEEFSLRGCHNLIRIDGSVRLLDKLKTLRLWKCDKLKNIPPLKLPSLESLKLHHCPSLENFPSLDGLLGSLKCLEISKCYKIRGIPPLKLTSLEVFNLADCSGLESFPSLLDGSMVKLKILRVEYCDNIKSFPPLMLPSLEELYISFCEGLESFPLVMDGSLGKLKSLKLKSCRNLKSFPQLKLASLENLELAYCGSLESFLHLVDGWMGKLKVLHVLCCRNHRSIPPIKFASPEKLELSCECCRYYIMGHIEEWDDTPLKELPFSFQDLTCLQTLYLKNCGIVQFPTSSIVAMSNLVRLTIEYGGWIFPKKNKGEEKVIPIQSSRVELLRLWSCNLSDESLSIGLKWFANVKELDLSWSEFTTLPECIKNCRFLWKLVMDYCEKLQEIKGIPPNVNTISAFNCSSLTSSCTSKLLNQELHKFGNTNFLLPGVEIPNWFDSGYMQLSVSFWFRNKFPAIALCAVSPMTPCDDSQVYLKVTINGMEYFYKDRIHIKPYRSKVSHLWLFHMQNQKFHADLHKELIENKWNHVVVQFGSTTQKSGIHVLKEISSMEDIRFDNPENDVSLTL